MNHLMFSCRCCGRSILCIKANALTREISYPPHAPPLSISTRPLFFTNRKNKQHTAHFFRNNPGKNSNTVLVSFGGTITRTCTVIMNAS